MSVLYAMGSNSRGECGQHTFVGPYGGVKPLVLLAPAIATVYEHVDAVNAVAYYNSSCVLDTTGNTLSVGGQGEGQQCNGNYMGHPAKIALEPQVTPGRTLLPPARQVAAWGAHVLALLADGRVGYMGGNLFGTAGNGVTCGGVEPKLSELPAAASDGRLIVTPLIPELPFADPVAVATGEHQSAVLSASGRLALCGTTNMGGVGPNGAASAFKYVDAGIADVKQVSVGGNFTLALKGDGSAWSVGANSRGQRGNGTAHPGSTWTRVPLPGPCTAVAAGVLHSLFLLEDSDVYEAGTKVGLTAVETTPTPVKLIGGAKAIAAGENTTFVVLQDGQLLSKGLNWYGQLGDNTRVSKSSLVPVKGPSPVWVESAETHTLLLA